jgi:hypothetical protein
MPPNSFSWALVPLTAVAADAKKEWSPDWQEDLSGVD